MGGRIPDRGNSLQRFGERNEKHTLVIKVVKCSWSAVCQERDRVTLRR